MAYVWPSTFTGQSSFLERLGDDLWSPTFLRQKQAQKGGSRDWDPVTDSLPVVLSSPGRGPPTTPGSLLASLLGRNSCEAASH